MCVCLKALLLGCFPLPFLSCRLPLSFLSRTVVKTLFPPITMCLSLPHAYTVVPGHTSVLSRKKKKKSTSYCRSIPLPPSPPPLLFPLHFHSLSFDIVSSLQTPIQLWHYASWSFTLRGLCPVRLRSHSRSDPRASVTLCLMLYSKWGCRISQALSQSKNPNI